MTIFEILNLRSQWEELAQTLNVEADSTISGLQYFVENSHKGNRFKEQWPEAMHIAEEILAKHVC
jgi:hypothetical protein